MIISIGIFGNTWQERLASSIYNDIAKINGIEASKLKSFWQAGGYNISLINKLYKLYNASYTSPDELSRQSGTSLLIVNSFLKYVHNIDMTENVLLPKNSSNTVITILGLIATISLLSKLPSLRKGT